MKRPVPCERPPEGSRRVTWLELFVDLVFVAAVAQLASHFEHGFTLASLGRYTGLFVLVWWAWHGYAVYATRFDVDDGVQRAATLLQMLAVMFMAANAESHLASESTAGFGAAYGAMRLVLAAQYLRAARVPVARRLARESAGGIGLASLLWIVSALLPVPWRYVGWIAALAIDVATAVATARHTTAVPPDADHLPERFGLFTLILLGESIIAIMKGVQHQPTWSLSAAGAAVLGLALLFGYWTWYFHVARAAAPRHVRSRTDARRLQIWNYVHPPLYLGIAVSGLSIEHVVRAGGDHPLHGPDAWLFAGGSALALGALGVLRAVAVHATSARPWRVALMHGAVVGVPVVMLGLAPIAPATLVILALALAFGVLLFAARKNPHHRPQSLDISLTAGAATGVRYDG